jgi:hypothetical protein
VGESRLTRPRRFGAGGLLVSVTTVTR